MSLAPRHIHRFESVDETLNLIFPMLEAETESSQEFRTAYVNAVGMHYAVDLHGTSLAPLGSATERIRAIVSGQDSVALDAEVDTLRRLLFRIGRGRLWSIGADGTERWAWARASGMPQMMVQTGSWQTMPVSIEFTRLSDWYAAEPVVIQQSINASPTSILIDNPGNAEARDIEFILRANAASGFNNPRITNGPTGESFTSTRVAANSSARWRVNTGRYAVEYSTDAGVTWLNDYANFSTGSTQVGFLRFLPGEQSLTVQGVTNGLLTITFYPTFT